jgi:hypothetical protein
MTEPIPIACSLGAGEMRERLAAMAALGAEKLIDHRRTAGVDTLRFRADEKTRQELERIVSAEAECCPFLELAVTETEDTLELHIDAPAEGRPVAEQLAAAFAGERRPASSSA